MEKKHPEDRAAQVGGAGKDARKERAAYQPPRIVKKRAVSRATLFTGTGPDSGGVVG
jgi:hypothetical protein